MHAHAHRYSYGIMCWEMFARQTPFMNMNPHQAVLAVISENARPEIPAFVPPRFQELIQVHTQIPTQIYTARKRHMHDQSMRYRIKTKCFMHVHSPRLTHSLQACWTRDPAQRPTFQQLITALEIIKAVSYTHLTLPTNREV